METNKKNKHIIKDSFGSVEIPDDKYWGIQTQRSLQNFTIHNEKMPHELIKAIVLIKMSCAIANAQLGKMNTSMESIITQTCQEILNGKYDGNFPLSVWQTGSGTQTNMNVNEVIANICNSKQKELVVHPNDHVNMSQSSNDVFPSAIHVMCVNLYKTKLIPTIDELIHSLDKLIDKNTNVIKTGRTHLQDATPIRLSQEFFAFKGIVTTANDILKKAIEYVYYLPIGGTAVGTGLNAPIHFDEKVCKELNSFTNHNSFKPMNNKFQGLSSKDAISNFHNGLKVLAEGLYKIANDIRWLSSGPNCGIGEILIPQNEQGSSIMPGKVNPTQCESMMMVCIQVMANNFAISLANTQGNFQLNTFMPLIAYNLDQSINLLADSINSFCKNCLHGIKPNLKRIKNNIENNLITATCLNTTLGYDKVATIVKLAAKEGISLKEASVKLNLLTPDEFDKLFKLDKMC